MSAINVSTIDDTKPIQGQPTTASVRANFTAIKNQLSTAKTELSNLSGVTDQAAAFAAIKQAASEIATGVVELATNAEVQTGTDTTRAITPAGLSSRAATETLTGLIELATSAEALGGTDATRAVTSAGLASSKSLAISGYMKFPGGLIAQWSTNAITLNASGDGTVAWPIAFPTAFLGGVVCNGDPAVQGNLVFSINQTTSTTTTLAFSVRPNPGAVMVRVNYIVVGN